MHSVSHHERQKSFNNPIRLPSLFFVFNTVLLHQGLGVGKDPYCCLKAHTVFSQIGGGPGRIHSALATTLEERIRNPETTEPLAVLEFFRIEEIAVRLECGGDD